MPVRHLAFPNGSEQWVCLQCGSSKVTKIVEGTEFPTLIRDGSCHYCGGQFDPSDKHHRPTRDHIIPKAKGGPDALWNTVHAHARCNTKKKDDWPTCPCRKCQLAIVIYRRGL